jgi:toxin ParE1/3/4
MEIRWTPEAASSLENISLRIAEGNPEAALKTVRIIFQRIEHLATFPHRGRVGREEGSRELVLAPLPLIAVYRVKESIIEILQIWHGAQHRN